LVDIPQAAMASDAVVRSMWIMTRTAFDEALASSRDIAKIPEPDILRQ
jgi:hypothetical protein